MVVAGTRRPPSPCWRLEAGTGGCILEYSAFQCSAVLQRSSDTEQWHSGGVVQCSTLQSSAGQWRYSAVQLWRPQCSAVALQQCSPVRCSVVQWRSGTNCSSVVV